MKRYGNLWEQIVSRENLELAYHKASKGKKNQNGVKRFEKNISGNLDWLETLLREKRFRTSRYLEKTIYEPKKRTIYILPFSPDRIVQHAVMNIVAPLWNKMFIDDSYACREGKGLHGGSRRTMEFVRKYRYCLKMDIRKFYPSVDQGILKEIIRQKIKCPDTLELLDGIITSFPGGKNVPIGNLTSQWFGNLYMHELDVFVKHTLRCRAYLRYCDDFCLFANDKAYLHKCAEKIEVFLRERLKLTLSKNDLFPVSRGVDFLGYRHFPKYVLLRKRTAKNLRRRLKHFAKQMDTNTIDYRVAMPVLASARGLLKWANTYNFKRSTRFGELTDCINIRRLIMKGFPKTLNTKQDVLNALESYPVETKAYLQELLDTRFIWVKERELAPGEPGVQSSTHKVVPNSEDGSFAQYIRTEDENCKLFRIGLTVAETEEIING